MDYIVADRVILPEDQHASYSENVCYLPECYQPNDQKRMMNDRQFTRAECGLPEQGVVFCCFNNSYKLLPEIFAIWMRLLAKTSGSVPWLIQGHPAVEANLKAKAEQSGIEPGRIVFAPRMKFLDHLARERLADIFLDTLPVNAHTTASDALWCGIPVLTCIGDTFAGRVAASLLHGIGASELIAQSLADYEALALRLAHQPVLLGDIKAKLARSRDTQPLFNTPRYARHLETAYRRMWPRAESGLPPEGFSVQPEAP